MPDPVRSARRHELQVFIAVVVLHAVDVMDLLGSGQESPDAGFNDQAVLHDIAVCGCVWMIRLMDVDIARDGTEGSTAPLRISVAAV